MRKSAILILSVALIGLLAVGEALSRGMGGGGGRGGGMGGGGSSFSGGGAAGRSPSMGNRSTGQRSTQSMSHSAQQPSKPSGGTAKAKPSQPSHKPSTSQAKPSGDKKVVAKPTKPSQPSKGGPSQQQVKNFLDTPSKGGGGPSAGDLAKMGGGAAAGALGVEAARQLLAEKPAERGEKPARPDQPATRPERPTKPEGPAAGKPGAPGRPDRPRPEQPIAGKPRPEHPIAKPPTDRPARPVHPVANPPYNKVPPHWWKWAGWGAAAGWIAGAHFSGPYYYGYGDNVYYEGDYVYIDGQQASTGEEYYAEARTLATSAPKVKAAETEEWLPLGVFGLYQGDAEDSNMVLQLAVNKKGVLSGTYYNVATKTERPIAGMVDQKTQRVAWTFADGKNTDVIMETGLANLTEDQAPALLHFGKDKTEQWLMVRQPEPKQAT